MSTCQYPTLDPETDPRKRTACGYRHTLVDFMTTAQFEQLKAAPKAEDRPKGRK